MLAIFIGAGLGALARWFLGLWLNPLLAMIPLGTLAVNLIGGYLVGLALPVFGHHPEWQAAWRLLVITGFLGGLTTFSTFSGEVLHELTRGEIGIALLLALLHLCGAVFFAWLGTLTVRPFL